MNSHDPHENSLGTDNLQGNFYGDSGLQEELSGSEALPKGPDWMADIEQTLQLGEQFMGAAGGLIDLARVEALLAFRTLPKLLMLWFLIMPVMLLTWCAFSAMIAWSVFAVSEEVGLGMLSFLLQQVALLFTCRWLYIKYRTRMTMPYTRAQINNFVRSTQDGFKGKNQAKE